MLKPLYFDAKFTCNKRVFTLKKRFANKTDLFNLADFDNLLYLNKANERIIQLTLGLFSDGIACNQFCVTVTLNRGKKITGNALTSTYTCIGFTKTLVFA